MSAAVNLSMTTIGAPSWGSSGTHGSQGPMRHGVRLVMAVLCRASEIGDGHAMGVATQIVEHTFRTTHGSFECERIQRTGRCFQVTFGEMQVDGGFF